MSIIALISATPEVVCEKLSEDIWLLSNMDAYIEEEIILSMGSIPTRFIKLIVAEEIKDLSNLTHFLIDYYQQGYTGSIANDLYNVYEIMEVKDEYAKVNLDGLICRIYPVSLSVRTENGFSYITVQLPTDVQDCKIAIKLSFLLNKYVKKTRDSLIRREYLLEHQIYSKWTLKSRKNQVDKSEKLIEIKNYYLHLLLPPKHKLQNAIPAPYVALPVFCSKCRRFCPAMIKISKYVKKNERYVRKDREFYRWKIKEIKNWIKMPISVTFESPNYTDIFAIIAFIISFVSLLFTILVAYMR